MSQYHLKFFNLIATFTLVFITGIGINIQPVFADDTDIYLDPVASTSEPLVMFTIDFRANLVSSVCTAGLSTPATVAQIEGCGAGYTTAFSTILFDNDAGIDGKISLFELIRAVLIDVFTGLEGIKVGLIMNHNHDANCEGPGQTGCSNGAMVMMGFESVDLADTNGAKAKFLSILENIPGVPGVSGLPDYHSFQGKEMYFELFRYLTGQDIYNGHNGWTDFDSSKGNPGPDDINLDAPEAMDAGLLAEMPFFTNTDPNYPNYPTWDESGNVENQNASGGHPKNTRYISPLDGASCAKIYVINIGDGAVNQESDSDGAIEAANNVNDQGMGITLSGSNQFAAVVGFMNDADLADATNGYARDTSDNLIDIDGKQNVISYFIESTAQNTQNAWASAGGTGSAYALGNDPESIKDSINSIFKSILSVSTTFVAPSVPVNVFNRSEIENQIFLALFEADEDAKPYWPGNLKKLNIVEVTITDPFDATQTIDTIEFQDANNVQALDPIDGRIKTSALSVWTTTGGNDLSAATDDADAGVDGRAVERGGAGQRIPGYLPRNADGTGGTPSLVNVTPRGAALGDVRNLWTTDDAVSPSSTLMALDYTEIPSSTSVIGVLWDELTRDISGFAADFASATDAEKHQVADALAFIRGFELNTSPDTTITGDVRSWILSDPLHSRPLAVNYGARGSYSATNPDIRLLMGTNDGLMHMIRNTTTAAINNESGEEVWAFAPRETMPLWDTLNRNAAQTNPVHPIAVDGAAIVYLEDNDSDGTIETTDSDKVYLYFGLRRGGKSFYALDISDPDNPEYLFSFSKYSDPLDVTSAVNSDFAELSQSWGTPVVGTMNYDGTGATPVLVFGGGYNGDDFGDNTSDDPTTVLGKDQANRDTATNKAAANATPAGTPIAVTVGTDDIDTSSATEVLEGNAIFIVDALTGALVWKAIGITGTDTTTVFHVPTLLDSIPSDITAVDTNGDGLLDRIYAGDTGGNVWRADIPNVTTVAGTPVDPRSTWTVSQLLKAGRHFIAADRNEDRRFFNRPDVVQSSDATGAFDAVLLGSGDRENPNAEDTTNFFYMIKDRATISGSSTGFKTFIPHSSDADDNPLADLTGNCLQDSSKDLDACSVSETELANGWFIELDDSDGGEKSVTPALTFEGVIFFTTFIPGAGSACGLSEGGGRLFVVNLDDATGVFNFDTSNDSSPSGSTDNLDQTSDNIGGGMGGGPIYGGGNNIINFGSEHNVLTPPGSTQWATYWYDTEAP